MKVKREAGENPARSRHCESGANLNATVSKRDGKVSLHIEARKSGDLPKIIQISILRGKEYVTSSVISSRFAGSL